MLPALILIGFAMITLGVALLFLGAVPFLAGKRISAWRSRLIGLVLVSFLPLTLGAWQASNALLGPDEVEGPVVTWVLFGVCWFVVLVILFRVVVPKKSAGRQKNPAGGAAPAEEPFVELELIEDQAPMVELELIEEETPAPKKAAPGKKKAGKPPVAKENPFDFS